ncbi:MAG: TrkH family potassium uptake protein [Methanomicrobiales archaeon]|nr:TrkH family potassium uptake protein [Methanomicrobiales archaeon]
MKRYQHLAMIAHDMGIVSELLGAVTLTPLIVLVVFREWDMLIPMLSVPATFFILGVLISRVPRSEHTPHLSVALVTAAITWMVVAIIGALPFVLGMHMSWTDSIFEAMSGWTGTGYTVMPSLDTTPHVIIFWRSFIQWIGGIGVIAFGVALLSRSGIASTRLFRAEGRPDAFMPSVASTGKRIWGMYLILTVIFIGLVSLAGEPLWDTVNLVMVSLATGGFAPHDAGIGFYNNPLFEGLLLVPMLAGMFPFKVYFVLFKGDVRVMFRNGAVRAILALAFLSSTIVSLYLYFFNHLPLTTAVRQGFFNTISGFATCGLQNANPHLWVAQPIIMITIMMVIGGAAGSTAGGIKVDRLILGYTGLIWGFKRYFVRGNVIVPFKHEGRIIPKNTTELELSKNMLIIILWLIMLFLATMLVLTLVPTIAENFGTHEVLFELVSAMSNVGLGLGILTPTSPVVIKWIYTFLMWVGRLEIVPVLILLMGLLKGFESGVAK